MVAATIAAGEGGQPPSTERSGTGALLRLGSRVVLPAVLGVALLVVLAYAVFPIRTLLDQRQDIAEQRVELAEIEAANITLQDRVRALNTEAEVERIARSDHGLVLPGEEAYAVLPPAPVPVRLPPAWPFTELAPALGR